MSSALPIWHATTSALTRPNPRRWSNKQLRCSDYSMHRTTFAAPAKGDLKKHHWKFCNWRSRRLRRKSKSRCKSPLGLTSWHKAHAQSRYASSSTKFYLNQIKTVLNTRPWSRHQKPPILHRWNCCKNQAPLHHPTSFITNGFCLKISPRARVFQSFRHRYILKNCHWRMFKPSRLTIPRRRRLTTRCLCKALARVRSRSAYTLPRPAWLCSRAVLLICWVVPVCQPFTCRATS